MGHAAKALIGPVGLHGRGNRSHEFGAQPPFRSGENGFSHCSRRIRLRLPVQLQQKGNQPPQHRQHEKNQTHARNG